MKKYAALLLISSLLFTGCSSSTKKVDNKYVVASLEKGNKTKNIFADDLYKNVTKSSTANSKVFNSVLQTYINKKFPIDDSMKEEADTIINQIKSYYESNSGDNYEDALNQALQSSGYKNLDDYRNKMIKQIQYANFLLNYVNKNYDSVFDDYYKNSSPRYASIIKVSVADMSNPTDTESAKLNEVKELLSNTDKTFGSIAQDYSDDTNTSSKKGNLGIVDNADTSSIKNTYGEDVFNSIMSLSEGGVSEAISGTDGYYFVKVTSTNFDKIKKDLKDTDIDSPLIAYDNYLQYIAFKSCKISYKDKDTQKLVESALNSALAERTAERGGTNE